MELHNGYNGTLRLWLYCVLQYILYCFFSFFYLYCLSVSLYGSCLCLWALLPDLNKMMTNDNDDDDNVMRKQYLGGFLSQPLKLALKPGVHLRL